MDEPKIPAVDMFQVVSQTILSGIKSDYRFTLFLQSIVNLFDVIPTENAPDEDRMPRIFDRFTVSNFSDEDQTILL